MQDLKYSLVSFLVPIFTVRLIAILLLIGILFSCIDLPVAVAIVSRYGAAKKGSNLPRTSDYIFFKFSALPNFYITLNFSAEY